MSNVDKKLDAWKNKLLDLGKRNRLLNYHDTKRANLQIQKPEFSELWGSFVLNENPLVFPYYDDFGSLFEDSDDVDTQHNHAVLTNQSIKDQQKTLRNLRNKSKTVMEEQGVNVLYLAFGFLKWSEAEHSHFPLCSPIILVPVSLSWESITSPFVLSLHEDEIVVNPTLTYKLEHDYGITLPAFDIEQSVTQFLLDISDSVKFNGWEVTQEVGLSLFSFLKINMYRDIELHHDAIVDNLIIRALCGDATAIDRSALRLMDGYDHDRQDLPAETFQVVDADASQQDAIICAKKGLSFILQGPPGTGKSQTITNIIAECLADGKKILFVSEKMAALEVVKRRLDKAGLGDFCLTLHSHKANKKEVLEQLRHTLDLSSKKANISDEAYQRLQLLQADKDQLNEYANELYTPVQSLNKTIYEVNGIIANLQAYEDIIFTISDVESTTPEQLSTYIVALTRFVETIGKMSDDYKCNPWYGANVAMVTNELRHDVGANVGVLIDKTQQLSSFSDEMCKSLRLTYEVSYASLVDLLPTLHIAANSPIVPPQWIWMENIDSLSSDLSECEARKTIYIGLRNELQRRYLTIAAADTAAEGLSANRTHTVVEVVCEATQLQQVVAGNSAYATWARLADIQILYTAFEEFKKRADVYKEKRTCLLRTYEPEIFSINYISMLQRFKSDYTSVLKVFNGQYKADKKSIQVLHREFVKKVDDSTVISILTTLKEIGEQQVWVSENSTRLQAIFGTLFLGLDTDFEQLSRTIGVFTEIRNCEQILLQIKDVLAVHESKESTLKREFDFEYAGIETDWVLVRQKLLWANSFRLAVKKNGLTHDFTDYVCLEATASSECMRSFRCLSELLASAERELNWYLSIFDQPAAIRNMSLAALLDKLIGCQKGLAQLEEWIDFRTARTYCEQNGLDAYVHTIEELSIATDKIVPIFKKRFYRMWLDAILPRYPAVMNFRRRTHENKIAEFSTLDTLQFEIAKARIKQKLINNLPSLNHFTSGVDEISILRRELAKQRRIMPLRRLFRVIPNLLPTLKPCLMMSPLSVSLFLEADSYHFDTVIFDEASQVCTENAIGAISRGDQVIIAGDSKQLPPTNFFNAATADSDFDTEDDETDDEYDSVSAFESILDEASLLPEQTLLWHYRSRHEHLIAFSNAQIYHNNLITFPSNVDKVADVGVEYIFTPLGHYDRGGRKGNPLEAQRVAELVFEHFRKFPNRSLGVIAFGEVQQQTIDTAIRKMRLTNQQYESFFLEDKTEPFFVKNLENVQGDERDTIIFSIGYARDAAGKMYMNFGPLSKMGGERRLNVAITRAKLNVKLVGSIHPTDIEVERITVDGPKLLRNYIDFAINGPSVLLSQITESDLVEHDSPFEEAVYNFLDRKGYKLGTQVGCSGYRIDMAVKHPTISGRYVLGIECDGASYHSARTARERDRLRQAVLEDMGWKIYRIWSTDWIKDPITEGQKLLDVVNAAIEQYDANNSVVPNYSEKPSTLKEVSSGFLSVATKTVSVEEKENPYGFDQYQKATFVNIPQNSRGYVQLTDCIIEAVKTEYPIHYELLCQKLAGLYGNTKATVKIRREVDYGLNRVREQIIRKGDFFYPQGCTKIPVRIPNTRKIEHISIDELEQAMLTIVSKCIGTTMEGLIAETVRAYGFNRTGAKITEAMQMAANNILTQGKIRIMDGKVVSNHPETVEKAPSNGHAKKSCTQCGNQLLGSELFCGRCGKKNN